VTAKILDGQSLARKLQQEISDELVDFIQNNGVTPNLAAVLVGDDPASEVYVRHKRAACERVGIESRLHRLPGNAPQDELLRLVGKLNKDDEVHGILVQLPLPQTYDAFKIKMAVAPIKDVDCLHPENIGRLVQGRPRFVPCTPQGVSALLEAHDIPVAGMHVVILGRSEIVGKPLANLLLQKRKGGDATVTPSRRPQISW
jgi:methylenetetrahydrofolate dehydrogenase (NADP+)/methenyltetrahydrofolate cyclohydrolase